MLFCQKKYQIRTEMNKLIIMTKLAIRVDLEGDIAEKFLKLKEKWGLKSYTETVRHLIKIMYDEIM